jgi:hypothetical protein
MKCPAIEIVILSAAAKHFADKKGKNKQENLWLSKCAMSAAVMLWIKTRRKAKHG